MTFFGLAGLLCLTGVVSCGEGSNGETSPEIVDVNGALDEYRDAQADLALPPGASWPATTPILEPSADAGKFEYGVGLQEAQAVWYCSWAREAISESSEQQVALDKLSEFPDQFGSDGKYAKGDDSLREYYDNIEEAGALGDLSPLQEHISLNCPKL